MFKMSRIKSNGQVSRQRYSISEMENFSDNFNDSHEINLEDLCGCWHSKELCPNILIFKDHNFFKLAILHVDDCAQVIPEICTIQDGQIHTKEGKVKLLLDKDFYLLTLVGMGEYYKLP